MSEITHVISKVPLEERIEAILHVERSRVHKKSRQKCIMLQVAEPNMFTCGMQDILKLMSQ